MRPKAFLLLISFVFFFFIAGGIFLVRAHNQPVDSAATRELIRAGLNADTANDPHAYENLNDALRLMLAQRKYNELDLLFATARSKKDSFSGGARKLSNYYTSFWGPSSGQTGPERDWQELESQLQQWKSHSTDKLAATLSMANFYVSYGFYARGSGYANTVAPNAWRTFNDRLAKAQRLLESIANHRNEDPMWYQVSLDIARPLGLPKPEERALFDAAIALDPDYRPFYRYHAMYLAPQWSGEAGDVTHFADEMYVKLGSVNGPIMYSEIAGITLCNCGEQSRANTFSMAKIVEGFHLSEEHYGPSLAQLNRLAFMALVLDDAVTLQESMDSIGLNLMLPQWDGRQDNIDRARAYLAHFDSEEPVRLAKAAKNTPEGAAFVKRLQADFDAKYRSILDSCRTEAGDKRRPFYFYLEQDAHGKLITGFMHPVSPFQTCFVKTTVSPEHPVFIPPPRDEYWSRLVVQ